MIERRTFLKMNKNVAPEYIQEGEYTDALNARILVTENGDLRVTKPKGTLPITESPLITDNINSIGIIKDEFKNQVYELFQHITISVQEILIYRYDQETGTNTLVFVLPFVAPFAIGTAVNGQLFIAFGINEQYRQELCHIAFYDNVGTEIVYNLSSGDVPIKEWYSRVKIPPLPSVYELMDTSTDINAVKIQWKQRSFQFCARFLYKNGMRTRFSFATELIPTGWDGFNYTTIRVAIPLPSDFNTKFADYAKVIKSIQVAFREGYLANWKTVDTINYPTAITPTVTILGTTYYAWVDFKYDGSYAEISQDDTDLGFDQVPLYSNDSQFIENRIMEGALIEGYDAVTSTIQNDVTITKLDIPVNDSPFVATINTGQKCLKPNSTYFIAYEFFDYAQRHQTALSSQTFRLQTAECGNNSTTSAFWIRVLNGTFINYADWAETYAVMISENQSVDYFFQARVEHVYYVNGFDNNSTTNSSVGSPYNEGSPIFSNASVIAGATNAEKLNTVLKDDFNYTDSNNINKSDIGGQEIWFDISNLLKFDNNIPYVFKEGDMLDVLSTGGNTNCGNNAADNLLKGLPIKKQVGRFLVCDYPYAYTYLCSAVWQTGFDEGNIVIGGENGVILVSTAQEIASTNIYTFSQVNTGISEDVIAISVKGDYCAFATSANGSLYSFSIAAAIAGTATITAVTGTSSFGKVNKLYQFQDDQQTNPNMFGVGDNGLVFYIDTATNTATTIPSPNGTNSIGGCCVTYNGLHVGYKLYCVSGSNLYVTTNFSTWTTSGTFTGNTLLDCDVSQNIDFVKVCGKNTTTGVGYAGWYAVTANTVNNSTIIGDCVGALVSIATYYTFQSGLTYTDHCIAVDSDGNVFGFTNGFGGDDIFRKTTDVFANQIRNKFVSVSHQYYVYSVTNTYELQFIITGDRSGIIHTNNLGAVPYINNSTNGTGTVLNYGAKIEVYTPKKSSTTNIASSGTSVNNNAIFYESILNTQPNAVNWDFGDVPNEKYRYTKYQAPNDIADQDRYVIGSNNDGDVFAITKTFRGTRWKNADDVIFSMTPISSDTTGNNDRVYAGWHKANNRPNISATELPSQLTYTTGIRFSEANPQNSLYNYLNTYFPLNYKTYPISHGELKKLQITTDIQQQGSVMLAIFERQTESIYVGRVQLNDIQGNNIVATSDAVLGSNRLLMGGYGTRSPYSVVQFQGFVFYWDDYKKRIVKYDNNGLDPISDVGIREWVKQWDYSSQIVSFGYAPVNFMIDPVHREVLCTFQSDANIDGQTIAYSMIARVWTTRYGFIPDLGVQLNDRLYSLKVNLASRRFLYEHNIGLTNIFYQTAKQDTQISTVFNQNFNIQKAYQNLWEESNNVWITPTDGITDAQGHVTDLRYEGDFEKINNRWYAGILNDKNTFPSIPDYSRLNGDPMISQYLNMSFVSKAINANASDVYDSTYLVAVNVAYEPSERTTY